MDSLPLLPTMAVGSYASPGWMFAFRERMSRGDAGPDDIEEAFRDATRIAITDQLDAGVDVLCDGEMRRMRFVYEAFGRIGATGGLYGECRNGNTHQSKGRKD